MTNPNINPVQNAINPKYKHHKVVPMITLQGDQELYLPMVLLTGREESEVEANAYADTLKMFKDRVPKKDEDDNQWKKILDVHRAYWTIFLSVRLPTDLTARYFESKAHVEDEYNWDEAGIIGSNYLEIRMTQPSFKNIDWNDPNAFQHMIDQIKKLGAESAFFLNGYTTHSVNQLIKYLVSERESYLKNSGSSGTL